MSRPPFVLRRLGGADSRRYFEQIANLHTDLIHGGILPLLGPAFLATLYREIATSRWSSVHAAMQNDTVVGFIAGTLDIWRCMAGFSITGYASLASRVIMRLWRPVIAWKVLDSFAYPFRKSSAADSAPMPMKHRAELLAIAVSPQAQGTGVGKALVLAFEETLRGKISQYSVTTNTVEAQSNAFYSAMGFTSVGEKRHHDLLVKVYSKQLGQSPESDK